jgi:cell wall-associated NlpC family hydrolase
MIDRRGIVINGMAALKHKPEQNYELADEVLYGSKVEILEDIGDWFLVETSYKYKGYVEKCNILEDVSTSWNSMSKVYVGASFADVMIKAKYSSPRIVSIPRGSTLALTGGKQDKWTEVMLPMGQVGWVREEALLHGSRLGGSDQRQRIVAAALLYLGTQYRWGGKTPMGIDCSGLSFMSYCLNGIELPRDSKDQMNALRKVSRYESKPGDLLFFPGHVAIYIGEDKFVHATGMDAVVKINSLNKDSIFYRQDLDEKYICTGTVF